MLSNLITIRSFLGGKRRNVTRRNASRTSHERKPHIPDVLWLNLQEQQLSASLQLPSPCQRPTRVLLSAQGRQGHLPHGQFVQLVDTSVTTTGRCKMNFLSSHTPVPPPQPPKERSANTGLPRTHLQREGCHGLPLPADPNGDHTQGGTVCDPITTRKPILHCCFHPTLQMWLTEAMKLTARWCRERGQPG